MKICADVAEAVERLDELIDLARRDDEVVICSNGHPVAVIEAIPEERQGTIGDVLALAAQGRPTNSGQTSNHDDLYDEHGLPK
jgi:antitoxin (DNA-binding transcriptional repressor) of toxin-antitoxin stability system